MYDFLGIGLVSFGSTEGIVTDKDTGVCEPCGDRFIVPARVFYTDLGPAFKCFDLVDLIVDFRLGVRDVAGSA